MRLNISRLSGSRRRKFLRAILTTREQTRRLARAYMLPVNYWQTVATDTLLPSYRRALAEITQDDAADLRDDIDRADAGTVSASLSWRELMRTIFQDISVWHFRRFVGNLRYATDIDLGTLLSPDSQAETVQTVLQRNVSLIRSVSDQTRDRIADIVFRGLTARTPVDQVAKEIRDAVGLSRDRARRIASDQMAKLSAALDEARMKEIGIDKFRWRHSGKVHYRPWHKERDGKVFAWDDPAIAGDKPGFAPFCACKAEALLE